MRTVKILVVALVILSSIPFFAQQADANVQQNSSTTAPGAQLNQSSAANAQASRHGVQAQGASAANGSATAGRLGAANSSASGSAAGAADFRPVQGELVGKLDSKNAKPGDPVVFKTTQKARTADGTVIPKGTRILGHVTEVQAHGKGSEDSHLGVVFDRAELKGGQTMALHSMIESVSPSASAIAMANNDADMFASPGPAPMVGGGFGGGGVAAGGVRSGGGMLGGGGAVGGVVGGAGSLAGNSVRAAGSAAGNGAANLGSTAGSGLNGTLGAAGSTAANAGGNLRGASLNGTAAGSGLLAARPTGIPGLMLAGDASGSTSGMLSASRRNVHLDSGTQMVLGVSSAVVR